MILRVRGNKKSFYYDIDRTFEDDIVYNRTRKHYAHNTPVYINLYTSKNANHYIPVAWIIAIPDYCYISQESADLPGALEYLSRQKNEVIAYCRDLYRFYWIVSRETSDLKIEPFFLKSGDILRLDIGNLRIVNYKGIGTEKLESLRLEDTRSPHEELSDYEAVKIKREAETVLTDIKRRMQTDGDLTKIPLTLAGYTKKILQKHNNEWEKLTLKSAEEYHACSMAYTGGLCAANPGYVGSILHDVYSYDIDSSYISRMVINRYPMIQTGYYLTADKSIIDTIAGKNLLSVGLYRFTELKLNDDVCPVGYLSKLHCKITGAVLDGKYIRSAKTCEAYLTSVDIEIINTLYSFKTISAYNLTVYRGGYIPDGIINDMLAIYRQKEALKGNEEKKYIYKLKKIILSSFYGCMGTSPEFYGGWEKYNISRKRVGFYPWAAFITAYARRELLNMIILCGDHYIYGNTDSVKTRGDMAENIERYNRHQRKALYNALMRRGIEPLKEFRKLGTFENDGHYVEFKTLGTQKYIYKDDSGNTQAVVAGLKKAMGRSINIDDFSDGYTLDKTESGAFHVKHIEGHEEFIGIDGTQYYINAEYVEEPTTFSLSTGIEGAEDAKERIQEILQSGKD